MKLTNVGIALRSLGDPSSLLRSARVAEKAGFHGAWLVEVAEVDTMALAASISQVTRTLHVATGVVNSHLRLPTLLAMGAATLSSLSNGRFILGVGAGSPPMSYAGGVPTETPLTRLRETLQILRMCMSGQKVDFHGKLFDVRGFQLGTRPARSVPILGAAMGLKALEVVVELADGVLLMMPTLRYMKDVKRTIDNTMKRLSRRTAPSVACHLVTAVSRRGREAEAIAKRTVSNYASIPVYRDSFVRMGFAEEISVLERARANQEGRVWEKVPTEMAERLIVYGTAEECAEKIAQFVKEGATHPVIYPCMTAPEYPEKIDEALRSFTPYVDRKL